jgi:tape measure domain-containing protein
LIVRELINLIGFKVDETQLRSAEQRFKKLGDNLQSIGTRMSMFVTAPFTALTIGIAKTLSQFEQLDVAFETMLGSTEKSKKLLDDLFKLTAETPFTVTSITQNAKQLLAVGVAYDEIIDTLIDLGNVSAGLSVPLERLALNFGQVKAQGKLTGRELRDFAVAGVPMIAELAKMFNVTEDAVADMVSAGKVGYKETQQAFRNMARDGCVFADLMKKQSATLGGLWSIMMDKIILSAKSMSDSLLPVFKKVVNVLIDLVGIVEKMNAKFKAFLFWFGATLAAVGPLALGLSLLAKAIAFISLKVVALSAPILGIIALLGLLLDDIMAYVKNGKSLLGQFLPSWDKLYDRIKKFFTNTKGLFSGFINSGKRLISSFKMILEGIRWNSKEIIDEGFKELRDSIAGVMEAIIDIILVGIEKSIPKIIGLLETMFPFLVDFGVRLAWAIQTGVLKGIGKGLWGTIKSGNIDPSQKIGDFITKGVKDWWKPPSLEDVSGGRGTKSSGGGGSFDGSKVTNVNVKMDLAVPRDTPENQIKLIKAAGQESVDKMAKNIQMAYLAME